MKMLSELRVVLVAFTPLFLCSETLALRIAAVGDSIVQGQTSRGKWGWGQVFPGFFDPSVEVFNLGAGGTSTKTYIEEGLWDSALELKADFVFIQFGHNDQKSGERFTNPNSTFRDNLRGFVADIRGYGGVPILVTPPIRRIWRSDGSIYTTQEPWVNAVRVVAAEEEVFCVDLFDLTQKYYEYIGPEDAALYQPAGDFSHYNRIGAMHLARMIAHQLWINQPQDCDALLEQLRFSVDSLRISTGSGVSNVVLEWSQDLLEWHEYGRWIQAEVPEEIAFGMEHQSSPSRLFTRAREVADVELVVVAGQSNAVASSEDGSLLTTDEFDAGIRFAVLAGTYPKDYRYPEHGRPAMKFDTLGQISNFAEVDRFGGFGVERGFARSLADKGIRNVVVVKVAVNGKGLGKYWLKEDPAGLGLYDLLVDEVTAVVEQLAAEGLNCRLSAILWPQFVNDCNQLDTASAYSANLMDFAADLRNDLPGSNSQTPFFVLECPDWIGRTYAGVVREQGALYAENDPFGFLISAAGLEHVGDATHLTGESRELAGIRMAHEWSRATATRLRENIILEVGTDGSTQVPRPLPAYVVIGGRNADLITKYEYDNGGKDLPSLLHTVDVLEDNNWSFGEKLSRRSVSFRLFRLLMEANRSEPICVIHHSQAFWSIQDAVSGGEDGVWATEGMPLLLQWIDWSPFELDLCGIFLQQGEDDAEGSIDSYQGNLRALISNLVSAFPDVPVVIGHVTDNSSASHAEVNSVIDLISEEFPNVYTVNSKNVPYESDGMTFTSSGTAEMAERMVAKLSEE
jgi:lysophospholipase L1-like esterase